MTRADVLTNAFIDDTMKIVSNHLYLCGRFNPTDIATVERIVRDTLEYQRRPTFTWSIEVKADTAEEARSIFRAEVVREMAGALNCVRITPVTEGE